MGQFLHFFHIYCTPSPPHPPNPRKIRILKKWKTLLEISWFYSCVPKTTVWGTVPETQTETEFFVIFSHFFCPSNNPENQNFEEMEKVFGDFFILHLCTKNHDHMMYASWDMECDRISCHLGSFFATLHHSQPEKPKFWKNEKNTRRYHHFTLVYHKWQSYDVCFQRYGARQTEFFVI